MASTHPPALDVPRSSLAGFAAVCGICLAAVAAAQDPRPLDLRLVPVTEGNVTAIREVHIGPERLPPPVGTGAVGVPSDIESTPPVGTVIHRPIGRNVPSSDKKWSIGAAGSPEMQAQLGQSAYEVDVMMDDGEPRVFRVRDRSRFYTGQRVTVHSGELEPVSPDAPWSP